jgi:hypothetical protein
LNQVRLSGVLMSGFLFGIVLSLVLCSGIGDEHTATTLDWTLFSFANLTELTTSGTAAVSAQSSQPLMEELRSYVQLYVSESYLLTGYGLLLIITFWLGASPRYLWPSVLLVGMGLLFMILSSFRYYTPEYWIYSDFFFVGAYAFLFFQLIERFNNAPIRIAAALVLVGLYISQYSAAARAYPGFNLHLRDRIEKADSGIQDVRDYSRLLTDRYGDNRKIIVRIVSDPHLNGSDRGIDLLSKPAIRRVVESMPELNSQVKPGTDGN